MTQTRKRLPDNPRAAARRAEAIDELLDPALFKALADPTRVLLLACLAKCGRPCAVGEIAECCSVDLSVVSRHLSMLARAGILEATREGRVVRYAVRHENLAAHFRAVADAFQSCCTPGACCEASSPSPIQLSRKSR